MNRKEYEEKCKSDLSNEKFYQILQKDPTEDYVKEIGYWKWRKMK